jgi:hypothetical protein
VCKCGQAPISPPARPPGEFPGRRRKKITSGRPEELPGLSFARHMSNAWAWVHERRAGERLGLPIGRWAHAKEDKHRTRQTVFRVSRVLCCAAQFSLIWEMRAASGLGRSGHPPGRPTHSLTRSLARSLRQPGWMASTDDHTQWAGQVPGICTLSSTAISICGRRLRHLNCWKLRQLADRFFCFVFVLFCFGSGAPYDAVGQKSCATTQRSTTTHQTNAKNETK